MARIGGRDPGFAFQQAWRRAQTWSARDLLSCCMGWRGGCLPLVATSSTTLESGCPANGAMPAQIYTQLGQMKS